MPVEIRELVIRATIDSAKADSKPSEQPQNGKQREELIAECVEQVLEILRKERER